MVASRRALRLSLISVIALAACAGPTVSEDAAAADADTRDASAPPADTGLDARVAPTADAGLDAAVAPDALVSSDAAGPTADGGGPGFWPPLASRGGPVLAQPYVATLTYADDGNRAALDAYTDVMVSDTEWWSATTSEYGVGALASLGSVHLTDAAPTVATEDDVRSSLVGLASAGMLPTAPDGTYDGVMYLLYFPAGASVTLAGGAAACSGWHGVHGETSGTPHLVYTLAIDCGPGRGFDHLGYLEAAASHELVEAATDPFVDSAPAYQFRGSPDDPWRIYGETTDRCVGRYRVRGGSVLARSWSNEAGAAGEDPCVPSEPGEIYYGVWTPTAIVHGAPGTTLVVPITGFARGTIPDFRVTVSTAYGRDTRPALDLSRLNEGITANLTLTLSAAATSGSSSTMVLYVGPTSNDTRNYPISVHYD